MDSLLSNEVECELRWNDGWKNVRVQRPCVVRGVPDVHAFFGSHCWLARPDGERPDEKWDWKKNGGERDPGAPEKKFHKN